MKKKKEIALKPFLDDKENAMVRTLVDSYYGIQKSRIETSNRISALQRDFGLTETQAKELHQKMDAPLVLAEKNILKQINYSLSELSIVPWLKSIRGIGPVLSAGIISGIRSASRFETRSKLWRYCGQAVIDGHSEKRVRGEKIHYSPFMKTLCWKIGESFVKTKGYYRPWYDKFKSEYRVKFPEPIDTKSINDKVFKKYSDGHIHSMAKRKVVKLFLSHLFEVWYELEGKPYRNAYFERMGYTIEPAPNKHLIGLLKK